MQDVNVSGTRRMLEAACQAGVGRIVYTSSVVTVHSMADQLGTEQDFVAPDDARSTYQRTKILAEQTVWELIRQGAPITIVIPQRRSARWTGVPRPPGNSSWIF